MLKLNYKYDISLLLCPCSSLAQKTAVTTYIYEYCKFESQQEYIKAQVLYSRIEWFRIFAILEIDKLDHVYFEEFNIKLLASLASHSCASWIRWFEVAGWFPGGENTSILKSKCTLHEKEARLLSPAWDTKNRWKIKT